MLVQLRTERTVELWEQRRDGWLLISSFACLWQKRKAFFFSPYLQSVWYPNEISACMSAFTFEPIKQCGRSEISQPLWFQSKEVGGLDVLHRCSSFTTPPLILMRTDNQSWEQGWSQCVCVWGSVVFFPPPSLLHVVVREVRVQRSKRRKCNCQWGWLLSVSR